MRKPDHPAGSLPNRPAAAQGTRAALGRWLLAGPGAVLAALATVAAMPSWLPAGAGGINAIALPVVLAPLVWAVPFFYACLAEDVARAAVVILSATAAQVALFAFA